MCNLRESGIVDNGCLVFQFRAGALKVDVMNPNTVFLAIANRRQSFVEASLLCALLELGAADKPTETTSGNLRHRNLPEDVFPKSTLHRVSVRLASAGVLSICAQRNTRTTYTVVADWLDQTLAIEGLDWDLDKDHRLVVAMHQLHDYDDAMVLCRLLDLPADRLSVLKMSELIEPFGALMDRHRGRRALYRLADRGLVSLAPKDRSGLSIALNAGAAAELLARPLPNLRYLRPDAFASQPYFIARAARLASAGADDQSVELGAADLAVSDVESRAGLPATRAQVAAVDDAASTSLST